MDIVLVQIETVCMIRYLTSDVFVVFQRILYYPAKKHDDFFVLNNHVWDLQIDEDRLQRVLDACGRNGNTGIDDALKLFAKQT